MLTVAQALTVALQHFEAGRLQDAEALFQQIICVQPDNLDALHYLGLIAYREGRLMLAADRMRQCLAINPNDAAFHCNLGEVYRSLGALPEATLSFGRAVNLAPDFPEAWNNLSNVLTMQDQLKDALSASARALELRPEYPKALNNFGVALARSNRLEEACAAFRRAVALAPDYWECWNNLGASLLQQGLNEESAAALRRALKTQPEFVESHFNLALALLALGNYGEGWQEYEWRERGSFARMRQFEKPTRRWNGERAAGSTILVHAEQGFGDTLQFVRYLPMARERSGARIVFECQPELFRLLREFATEGIEVVAQADSPPYFDFQIPLLSLPLTLKQFDPVTITVPYLHAENQQRLPKSNAFRVGLVWSGSRTPIENRKRSMPPESLIPLLLTPGVEFFSLQAEELDALPEELRQTGARETREWIRDFADTAALMMEMDLIITVDTAGAHLAGALGRPVWTMLAFACDWRWGEQGQNSPWYPTMRLFRQPRPGDWDSVIQKVSDQLRGVLPR